MSNTQRSMDDFFPNTNLEVRAEIHHLPSNEAGPRTGGTPRPRKRIKLSDVARQFIADEALVEAEADGREESASEDEDNITFIDDSDEEEERQLMPSEYAAIDAMIDSPSRVVRPYFPLAFARSKDEPLQFNFELRVLDELRLPSHLPPDDEDDQPVVFEDASKAVEYLSERVAALESSCDPPGSETPATQTLSKEALFYEEGNPLIDLLTSGKVELDENLDKVRLDRFGNVAILTAPKWSDAAVQFTHGYPKRLIRESHGGFLSGNVIACARATNLCLRRMAIGDIACNISQQAVEGVGLSLSKLLSCRFAAIKYSNAEYCPAYLLKSTIEFGVNFATFDAVQESSLRRLEKTLAEKSPQLEDDEGLLPSAASPDLSQIVTRRSVSSSDDGPVDLNCLLWRMATNVSRKTATQDGADRVAAEPEANPASCGHAASRRRPSSASNRCRQPYVLPLMTEQLEGFRIDVMPTGPALKRLKDFLARHKPTTPEADQLQASIQATAGGSGRNDAERIVSELWHLCRNRSCTCQPNDGTLSTRGADSVTCPEQATPPCPACQAFSVVRPQLISAGGSSFEGKNLRLRRLLGVSSAVKTVQSLALSGLEGENGVGRQKSKSAVTDLLTRLLCVKANRVSCMKNVARLAEFVPKILEVQLEHGWSEFWPQMRKLGKAVGKQPNSESGYAALIALRLKLTSDSLGAWNEFLTSGTEAERTVLERHFSVLT